MSKNLFVDPEVKVVTVQPLRIVCGSVEHGASIGNVSESDGNWDEEIVFY